MFEFFKKLFSPTPSFNLGAHLNGEDKRDIHIAAVQKPVDIPDTFKSDLSIFDHQNQGAWGTCVWQARRMMRQLLWFKKTGEIRKFSARSGYIPSKEKDGIPYEQGTFPRVADQLLFQEGIAEDSVVPDENFIPYDQYMSFPMSSAVKTHMKKYVIGGYAAVPADFEAVKQAIYQNGAVTATTGVDTNWFSGIIAKVLKFIGYHNTLWYGYDHFGIYAKNSWGTSWIQKIVGTVFAIPNGDFYFKWEDYKDNCFDIVAYVDSIPPKILDNVKSLDFYFANQMKIGQENYDILKLQERLDKEGCWKEGQKKTGLYGTITKECVRLYQIKNGIAGDGSVVGPMTLKALNKHVKLSLVEAMIIVESRGNLYAVGDKNLKNWAYGCLQIRKPVCDDVNAKYKTHRTAEQMLGDRELSIDTFNKYISIYEPNGTNEEKARLWNAGPGWRLKKPLTDGYWAKVSALL